MITNLGRQRSARISPMQASVRSRPGSVAAVRDIALESTRDPTDGLSLKLSTLEAELVGLRQTLAEVTANRNELRKEMDDLRRDRDHWRKLAEPGAPKPPGGGPKTWFCGSASSA